MSSKQIINVLGSIAPTIATALGGPLAGVATKALAAQLLGTTDATVEQVEAAIRGAVPADLQKIQAAEIELERVLADANISLEQIAATDRASARNRQVETQDKAPAVLAAVVLIGFFAVLAYVILYGLPENGGEVIMLLIGAVASFPGQVLNFYFGSSVGSKNKDSMIERLKATGGVK